MTTQRTNYPAGMKFTRWAVVERAGDLISTTGTKVVMLKVRCECGSVANIRATTLTTGRSKSCGCLRDELAREREKGNKHRATYLSGLRQAA